MDNTDKKIYSIGLGSVPTFRLIQANRSVSLSSIVHIIKLFTSVIRVAESITASNFHNCLIVSSKARSLPEWSPYETPGACIIKLFCSVVS